MNNNIIPACIIGAGLFAVALKPAPQPAPISQAEPAAVATASVTEPSEPYVVEYDFITTTRGGAGFNAGFTSGLVALRIWSDGLIEQKNWTMGSNNSGPYCPREAESCDSGWIPLPGSSDGYACRSDIDGDRQVDFDDLLMVINDWAQPAICNPHPEIDCRKAPFQPPA